MTGNRVACLHGTPRAGILEHGVHTIAEQVAKAECCAQSLHRRNRSAYQFTKCATRSACRISR